MSYDFSSAGKAALSGAATGATVGGPWGALIGAGAGIIGDGINQSQTNSANKKATAAINAWNQQASGILDKQQAELDKLNASNPVLTDTNAINQYLNLRDNTNPSDYIYNAGQFDKSAYNVEDYLNENKDKILADVGKSVQNTAAGAGLGHSSGALEAIVNNQMDKSEQLYNDAYSRMTDDRNFDYGSYTDFINQQQSNLDRMYQMNQNTMNNLRSDIQFDQNTAQQQYQNQMDINNSRLGLGQSVAQSKANIMV